MNTKKVELSEEELERVNKIIVGIQTDLNYAIEKLKTGDFKGALEYINKGINKSNCPLCKRELGILIADVVHNKEICILKADTCEDEQKVVIDKAIELKEDFVPVTQTKKALKDKKKDINKALKEREKELGISNIRPVHIPYPHELFPSLFSHKK